jgi:hypothetical protein
MRRIYEIDILQAAHDSLEGVMGQLYPDLYDPALTSDALPAFRDLVELFTQRLATTTNELAASRRRLLYRMLVRYMGEGFEPGDITIATFNQDLQVEKILEHLGKAKRWSRVADALFCFPHMYATGAWKAVTAPSGGGLEIFEEAPEDRTDCIRVLKLHGSLNWYSTHNSRRLSPDAMFRKDRPLRVTCRKTIDPTMGFSGPSRRVYSIPVVIPPVNHKTSVLHDNLRSVWSLAEQRLREADELVVFGYSCPALDFESSNLLRRANRKRPARARTIVIDPVGSVASRYIEMLEPTQLQYFPSANAFLER